MDKRNLPLRVICIEPPPDTYNGRAAVFGLQDKTGEVQPGIKQADGSLHFECHVEVSTSGDAPNFLGKWTHGTPQARFLYLSYGYADSTAQVEGWIKRIKIALSGISHDHIQAVGESGLLEVVVDGRRAASAALLRPWSLVSP